MNILTSHATPKAIPDQNDTLIPSHQAPRYLGIARQTLARWRCEGGGPRFVKLGRLVFYRAGDLRAWIIERTCTSTSALPGGVR